MKQKLSPIIRKRLLNLWKCIVRLTWRKCWNEHQAAIQAKKEDPEQWECCRKCGNHVPYLSSYRDPDEGMCGPVYEACPDCVSKFYQSYEDECEWLDDEYY